MPITAKNVKEAEAYEDELRGKLADTADPEYEETTAAYNKLSRGIDDYYKGQRKTDASGKLTAPAGARSGSIVQGNPKQKQFDYHFEPSVAEVRTLLKNSPELVKQYGLQSWLQPGATPPTSMPMVDTNSGAQIGANQEEPQTFVDAMNENSSAYQRIAEHMWRQKADQAKAAGVNLKRYKDIHFQKGQGEDFLKGGLEYNIDRRLAPAALGAADTFSAGAASPLYDMAVERANKIGPNRDTQSLEDPSALDAPEYNDVADPMSGQVMGTDEAQLDTYGSQMPTSQEVKDRAPGIYHGANMLAYGLPGVPTNLVQGTIAEGLGYGEKNAMGAAMRSPAMKAVVSGLAGGFGNAFEGAVRDTAEGVKAGKSFSDIASDVGAGVPVNTGMGVVGGVGGDLIAQGSEAWRNRFRQINPDIRTMYNAGGDTSMVRGVKPSPEVNELVRRGTVPRPPGTPGALAANELVPKIEGSLNDQDIANTRRIGDQTEEYFNHPAYRDIRVKGTRLVQALVDMTREGSFKSPVTGTSANLNPGLVHSVNKELGAAPWAEPRYVSPAESAALAHQTGGVVVDADTAQKMFGPDDTVRRGDEAVIIPHEFTARELTTMENKVDRILKMYSEGDAPADPVYEHLNAALKDTRDEFPRWEDENGNLVAPPEEGSQSPFAPASEPKAQPGSPPEEMRVLPKPINIESPRGPGGDAQGVGPGQPDLPGGPFERRAARPQVPESPLEAMARPIDVTDDFQRRPEGLNGVGPENPQLYLPRNPFESLPGPTNSGILAESIQPNQRIDVQGDHSQPEFIPPQHEAIPGPGPRRDRSVYAVDGKRQMDVTGGDYAQPQSIEPDVPPELTDMSPTTERMPIGLPPEASTPLSEMAGVSDAPMSVQPEELMSVAPPSRTEPAVHRPLPPREVLPTNMSLAEYEAAGGKVGGNVLPANVQEAIDRGYLPDEAIQKAGSRQRNPIQGDAGNQSTELTPETAIQLIHARYSTRELADRAKDLQRIGFRVTPNNLHAAEIAGGADRIGRPNSGGDVGNTALYDTVKEEFHPLLDQEVQGFESAPRSHDDRGGLERMLDEGLGDPNKSQPTPGGKEWSEANKETKDWSEGIMAPGREKRSSEAERMAEKTGQQEAHDEAVGRINAMEDRLGPLSEKSRLESILSMMSHKLGRQVTKEDLVKAGIISAGVAASFSDDEDTQKVGAGAMLFGGFGKKGSAEEPRTAPKKGPTQPEATLPNGRVVRGFSAMRHKQSESMDELKTAMRRAGVTNEKTLRDRLVEFGQTNNKSYDDVLEKEAEKLGLREELWRVPAADQQIDMRRNRAVLGSGKGFVGSIVASGSPRLDAIAGLLSGAGRNPYAKGPDGLLEEMMRAGVQDPARNVMNLSEGRAGARYGDDLQRIYDALAQQFQSAKRKAGGNEDKERQP